MASGTTQAKSFPILPTLLGVGATAGITALAVRIYRHPYKTLVDIARAGNIHPRGNVLSHLEIVDRREMKDRCSFAAHL